jgi:predicted RNA binding protein YcfA (HicA-like mRNA interferase family)
VTRLQKRIVKMRQHPRNVPSDELVSVLLSLGFERRGGKGSHQCFKHPGLPEVKLTVPKQNPLRRTYVVQALNAIHKLVELDDDD